MVYVDDTLTIPRLLERRAQSDGLATFCVFEDRTVTFGWLNDAVTRVARELRNLGIRPGDLVGVMLPNHPEHIATMLALIKSGAIWVPINAQLRGPSLSYVVEHAEPRAIIADTRYRDTLEPALTNHRPEWLIWRGPNGEPDAGRRDMIDRRSAPGDDVAWPDVDPHDVVCISYTSGTTGPPKGVLVTDKMLRAAATGARLGGHIQDGDVLLVWEPLYHIGGSQIIVLALMRRIRLILVERFSASRFWDRVRAQNVTHIHHLGGILHILLKQPPSERDREHNVRISWGGGCSKDVWSAVEARFGVTIRELYGMTEASSISTASVEERRIGSIGKPLPYFDVRLVDDRGLNCQPGVLGELLIRGREPGLITPGYFRNPEATAAALRDGWLYTGDLARVDHDGFLYYSGRKTDSVRHHGENVSAWEVERVVNVHPDVEESALVGVATDIGEQDLKILIKLAPGRIPDPQSILRWCQHHLPRYQVPRYIAFVDEFDKTPTLRIKKEGLPRSTDGWDRLRDPSDDP